ncbi:MAG: L-2-amino-thiazoline-4-carboxylic acid hydrolase [Deltaproteobacteria bacterium]|jgi:hypothetical protein|nr:L-2-amino-thiazoline-4-carboxylic acid hydrolase [Deltaproteobacteria bacterium]
MSREEIAREFYVDDHALLFALLAKNILSAAEREEGLEIIRRGVTEYGLERGLRYARRCLEYGDPLTVPSYMAHSELVEPRAWNKSVTESLSPYKFNTVTCGWCATWKKYNLLEYGKLYCSRIDVSLLRGFNRDIVLEVSPIMSHGSEVCSFTWKNFGFRDQAQADLAAQRRRELLPLVGRDFLYHCAHLLSTLRRAVYFSLGAASGSRVLASALRDYAGERGESRKKALLDDSRQDFCEI